MPMGNAAVEYDAVPPVSGTVCSVNVPSRNVTVPVGVCVLEPEGDTVAVKVTV